MNQDKKKLYESIMTAVAREVKKALNELSSTAYNDFEHAYQQYFIDGDFSSLIDFLESGSTPHASFDHCTLDLDPLDIMNLEDFTITSGEAIDAASIIGNTIKGTAVVIWENVEKYHWPNKTIENFVTNSIEENILNIKGYFIKKWELDYYDSTINIIRLTYNEEHDEMVIFSIV